jgi:hypothetical protein
MTTTKESRFVRFGSVWELVGLSGDVLSDEAVEAYAYCRLASRTYDSVGLGQGLIRFRTKEER